MRLGQRGFHGAVTGRAGVTPWTTVGDGPPRTRSRTRDERGQTNESAASGEHVPLQPNGTEPLHEQVDTPIDGFRLDDARSGTPLRGRDATRSLLSVSVSVSIHSGTTRLLRCQPSRDPQDSDDRSGRERVGMDLESA